MIKHLIELGLWNESIRRQITNDNGSVQGVEAIPADVREIYKTVWEIKQSELLERTARRGAWVDQSQSFNVHVQNNSNAVLRGIMFAGWKLGLKTGTYYIRTRPAAQAFKTNLAAIAKENTDRTDRTDKKYSPVEYSKLPVVPFGIGGLDESDMEPMVCKMEPGCTMCSS
jgi:ribonucleotide reductase alpha subunit